MKSYKRLLAAYSLTSLLLVLGACTSGPGTAPPAAGTATPDVQATVTALANSQGNTAMPSPAPEQVRREVQEFAAAHLPVEEDWDQFHREFDQWRTGLMACDPRSVEVALREFAGRADAIAQDSRALSRPPALRSLANKLVNAAELEAAAFRSLRDNWRNNEEPSAMEGAGAPENSAALPGAHLFEQAESALSKSQTLRVEVADALDARQASLQPDVSAALSAFTVRFQNLENEWDQFHRDYDAFRAQEGQLSEKDAGTRLGALLSRLSDILDEVRALPTADATRQISQRLAAIGDAEQLALRRLGGSINGAGGQGAQTVPLTPEETPASKEGAQEEASTPSEVAKASGFSLSNPTLFDLFDSQVAATNSARRGLRQELSDITYSVSDEGQTSLLEFSVSYRRLTDKWDGFHADYADWRRTEGGCNRASGVATLGDFAARFGEVAAAIRDLPDPASVRKLSGLLLSAAERELAALQNLRDTWRPFDLRVYQVLNEDRRSAAALRRQVDIGVRDLLDQHERSLEK